jgi:hypothetical protein
VHAHESTSLPRVLPAIIFLVYTQLLLKKQDAPDGKQCAEILVDPCPARLLSFRSILGFEEKSPPAL